METVLFSVFGSLRSERGTNKEPCLGPTERAVMASLLFTLDRYVTLEEVTSLAWRSGNAPKNPAHAIQTHVMRLRRHLGPNVIESSPHAYRAAVEPADVDVYRFCASVEKAEVALRADDLAASEVAYVHALGQRGRGAPWRDLAHNRLVAGEQARLIELQLVAEERRAALALLLGRLPVGELERLTIEEPLREIRWVLLMQVQAMQGRQADALRSYTRARLALQEIGIDPGPALRDMEHRVLDQDALLYAPIATWGCVQTMLPS